MARDIAEVAGGHIHGIELHPYAVRIDLEPDPRYGARILRADVDGVVHFDTRSDAMGDGRRCIVGRDRLNLDGYDVREPAPPGGVLSEPDDVERATRWNDDHRVLVLDRVRQRRTEHARVLGRCRRIVDTRGGRHQEPDLPNAARLNGDDVDRNALARGGQRAGRGQHQPHPQRLHVRHKDEDRVYGGIPGAVGGAADDLDQTARAGVGREGDGARDGVALDLSGEDGVDDGNEPAAER